MSAGMLGAPKYFKAVGWIAQSGAGKGVLNLNCFLKKHYMSGLGQKGGPLATLGAREFFIFSMGAFLSFWLGRTPTFFQKAVKF